MAAPVLIGNVWYLRIRTPSDLLKVAQGRTLSIPVGEIARSVQVRDYVKVSLGTRDPKEAKRVFPAAYAAVQDFWSSLRDGPQPLSHRQMLALAGEVRMAFVDAYDNDPGSPDVWEHVIALNDAAKGARLNPLTIPTLNQQRHDLEERFGKITDAVLSSKGLAVEDKTRLRLIQFVADALTDAARVNQAKAGGDYSDSGETAKYPAFEPSKTKRESAGDAATFDAVITKEAERRAAGKTAVPGYYRGRR